MTVGLTPLSSASVVGMSAAAVEHMTEPRRHGLAALDHPPSGSDRGFDVIEGLQQCFADRLPAAFAEFRVHRKRQDFFRKCL